MMAIDRERRRVGWLAGSMFVLFILASSAAYTPDERLQYGGLPLAATLLCIGRLLWIHGNVVRVREHFSLYPWRSQMFEYSGRKVLPFVWALRTWAGLFALLGMWTMGLWLRRVLG